MSFGKMLNRDAVLEAIKTRERERKELDNKIANQQLMVDLCKSSTPVTLYAGERGGVTAVTGIDCPVAGIFAGDEDGHAVEVAHLERGLHGLKQDHRKKVLEEKFFRYLYNGNVEKCEKYIIKCQENDSDIVEFFFEDLREGAPVFFNPPGAAYEGEEALRQMGDWMKKEHDGRKAALEALKLETPSGRKVVRRILKRQFRAAQRRACKGK